jgi:Zn-dependent metalloprotease
MKLTRFKVVPGTQYGTPKEVWGFRTKPRRGRPRRIAKDFLETNCELLAIESIPLPPDRVIESLGAYHVIHQQRFRRLRIHRAYVTVHLDRKGRVYLVKNRAVPRKQLKPSADFKISKVTAGRTARHSVTKKGSRAEIMKVERMWFPLKSKLRPVYRVRVCELKPRGDWLIVVDGNTGLILRKYDNLASAYGVADVFDPNPVVTLRGTKQLLRNKKVLTPPAEAYTRVRLRDLDKSGYLDGPRVTTNATKRRVQRKDGQFIFTSDDPAFEEVMAYFHIDRAIGYLESMGYRGPRSIFNEPISVDANGTEEDNAWYSPHERRLTFGLGDVDEAEDAEIILHELGHAIQDAICPGFGQSAEAAAMGEGFGDYFAASFFAEKKAGRFQTAFASWDGIEDVDEDPPYVRKLNEPATFESFDHSDAGEEHDNGQIWSATLWKIRTALGGAMADRIILESHFQLDGFTTFARGARAILDADRNLNKGRHLARLRKIFHRQGIGPVE